MEPIPAFQETTGQNMLVFHGEEEDIASPYGDTVGAGVSCVCLSLCVCVGAPPPARVLDSVVLGHLSIDME